MSLEKKLLLCKSNSCFDIEAAMLSDSWKQNDDDMGKPNCPHLEQPIQMINVL